MNLTRVLYFTTSTVIDWVDIFTRPSYRHIIVDSLSYCQSHKGLIIYAWVLMSNHLHMIVDTNDEKRWNRMNMKVGANGFSTGFGLQGQTINASRTTGFGKKEIMSRNYILWNS